MIFDLDNNPITAGSVSVEASGDCILTIRIDCRAGFALRADAGDHLTIEARKSGDSVWINLQSSEIDLSAYTGNRIEFEIRLSADASTGIESASVKVERL